MDLIDCGAEWVEAFMLQFNWEWIMTTPGGQVAFTFEWYKWEQEPDDSIELHVTAQVTRYHPAVMHLSNGDPGYPQLRKENHSLRLII